MTLWLVRAGRHGEREDLALEKNFAIVGAEKVGDLSSVGSREGVIRLYEKAHPEAKSKSILNWASQLWTFKNDWTVGDLVVMPLKTRAVVAVGKVAGTYEYRAELPADARHVRAVHWIKELPRNTIDQDLLYSFGASMTVCRIRRNNAEERVLSFVAGRTAVPAPIRSSDPTDLLDENAQVDIEQFARDQIREHISRTFRGHDLTELVAAVLRAQGFKVRVSPAGADGGVDIIAGKGSLGFDPPRLAAQVKSSDGPVDVKVLRELQGSMKNFGANQGLFVSWGGYKSSVPKESVRSWFEIRLWDADDLVRMVQENYDQLPDELQAELPLKRIWALVLGGEQDG